MGDSRPVTHISATTGKSPFRGPPPLPGVPPVVSRHLSTRVSPCTEIWKWLESNQLCNNRSPHDRCTLSLTIELHSQKTVRACQSNGLENRNCRSPKDKMRSGSPISLLLPCRARVVFGSGGIKEPYPRSGNARRLSACRMSHDSASAYGVDPFHCLEVHELIGPADDSVRYKKR